MRLLTKTVVLSIGTQRIIRKNTEWLDGNLCANPKTLGGLGITNTSIMNKRLIMKWWWLIYNEPPETLWIQILKAKYFPNTTSFFAHTRGGSQFRRAHGLVRNEVGSLVKFVVGDGKSTRFLLDLWFGDGPLASSFPILFSYVSDPLGSITKLASHNWDLGFRRALSSTELDSWQELTACFPVLSENPDSITRPHSPSGRFIVKSLYSRLCAGGRDNLFKAIWRSWIPLKIRIFLWQAIKRKLPASDQIIKRHGNANAACALCGKTEDTEHILFNRIWPSLAGAVFALLT